MKDDDFLAFDPCSLAAFHQRDSKQSKLGNPVRTAAFPSSRSLLRRRNSTPNEKTSLVRRLRGSLEWNLLHSSLRSRARARVTASSLSRGRTVSLDVLRRAGNKERGQRGRRMFVYEMSNRETTDTSRRSEHMYRSVYFKVRRGLK